MDADSASLEQIQEAMENLQEEGYKVRTRVFAAPRQDLSKRWAPFFQRKEVLFQPVSRNPRNRGEANDEAIVSACKRLAASRKNRCIALLASDCGYKDVLRDIAQEGTSVCLCTSTRNVAVIDQYRGCGVRVIELVCRTSNFSKVRAVLHANGGGHVELAEPFKYDASEDHELCNNFLHDLGYMTDIPQKWTTQSTAKFWFANSLGSLIVFPQQFATKKVCRMASSRRQWRKYRDDLVLLLPVAAPSRMSRKQQDLYGTSLSRQIYRGGGPVMLKDSRDLVQRAFTKLGYLDGDLNTDMEEAALVFVNASRNTHVLRKELDLLPTEKDSFTDTIDKLRCAFRSNLSQARWKVAPSDSVIRRLLCKHGLLSNVHATAEDVLAAMTQYSLQHGLPTMRSYNGYVFRILRSLDSNPTTTSLIEISS